jgi:hypothetical protein
LQEREASRKVLRVRFRGKKSAADFCSLVATVSGYHFKHGRVSRSLSRLGATLVKRLLLPIELGNYIIERSQIYRYEFRISSTQLDGMGKMQLMKNK